MTHNELVGRAVKWLKNSQKCPLVLSETYATLSLETPDAIGFKGRLSLLVECKTSRADFCRDKRKLFRIKPQWGLGVYRYYLTDKGLLNPNELPWKWGLLEVRGKIIRKVKEAQMFNAAKAAYVEKPLLISAAVYAKAV